MLALAFASRNAAQKTSIGIVAVRLHEPRGTPGVGVDAVHTVLDGLLRELELATIMLIPDVVKLAVGGARRLQENGVHPVIVAAVRGADAVPQHGEAHARVGAVEQLEELMLVLLRDVQQHLGPLEGAGEAEAFDLLVLDVGADRDAGHVGVVLIAARWRGGCKRRE